MNFVAVTAFLCALTGVATSTAIPPAEQNAENKAQDNSLTTTLLPPSNESENFNSLTSESSDTSTDVTAVIVSEGTAVATNTSVDPTPTTKPTSTTTTELTTTTAHPSTTTVPASTAPPSTSAKPTIPPSSSSSTTTTSTISSSSPPTNAPSTKIPSTPQPDADRRFDGPSFIGGIVFALGVTAISFVAWKFYKARTERNYHTL